MKNDVEMLLGSAVTPEINKDESVVINERLRRENNLLHAQNNAYYFALQLIYADHMKQINLTDVEREELFEVFKQLKEIVYADSE